MKSFFWSAVIYVVLGAVAYFIGQFLVVDSIVPDVGISIDEWMESYNITVAVVAVIGFVCSCGWNIVGKNYAGESGINAKYMGIWCLSFVLSLGALIFILNPSQEGSTLADITIVLLAPLGYYISSLWSWSSESAVKFIPPLGEKIHG